MRQLSLDRAALFTSNFVLAEMHALLLTRLGRQTALRVLTSIEAGATRIMRVEPGDERRAREIILRYDDKNFSLTDATCFSIMERYRMAAAFTFDRNFMQYGLTVLRP
jgi:predicted nucleic acid-binding protein